jgi:hypothetical protein
MTRECATSIRKDRQIQNSMIILPKSLNKLLKNKLTSNKRLAKNYLSKQMNSKHQRNLNSSMYQEAFQNVSSYHLLSLLVINPAGQGSIPT